MKIYDITMPVQEGIAVWPGDAEYQFTLGWKMADGQSVNVGTVSMSVHTGTHMDAPFHYEAEGAGAGELDLSAYLGPAIVVEVTGQNPIERTALEHLDFSQTPRLLLKTGAWSDRARFPEAVPTLASDVPAWLGEKGVVLVGFDIPSVDELESKDLPLHHALNNAGIRILESLDLAAVPPGAYELIALPLKLMGADGSPVRAILRG